MRGQALFGLLLAIALNSGVVLAAPKFKLGNVRFGNDGEFDNDFELVNSVVYNIITAVEVKKGLCIKHLRVTGNGVGDVFTLPCSENGVHTFITDKIMLYGKPELDSFSLYSEEPSTLIAYQDEGCTKRKYSTVSRITTPEITELSEEECVKFRNKINNIVNEESRYLSDLAKRSDERKQETHHGSSHFSFFKSASETKNGGESDKQKAADNQAVGANSFGSYDKPKKSDQSPLELYRQFLEFSKTNEENMKTAVVSHQQHGYNGVTVTEQVNNAPDTVPQADAEEGHATNNGGLQNTRSLHTYMDRLGDKFAHLKEGILNHFHHSSSKESNPQS